MAANPDFRIEHRDGADRVAVSPLDTVDELASLVSLRALRSVETQPRPSPSTASGSRPP